MTLPPAAHRDAGVAETKAAARANAMRLTQGELVVKIVATFPGLTAPEIAQKAEQVYGRRMTHEQAQRRLSDQMRMGALAKRDDLRRKCSIKGTSMAVWTPELVQGVMF